MPRPGTLPRYKNTGRMVPVGINSKLTIVSIAATATAFD